MLCRIKGIGIAHAIPVVPHARTTGASFTNESLLAGTEAFTDAGARLYNEAILISPVGSLAVRVSRFFTSSRKLGKTHQQVLVFVKGDPKKATQACGDVEVEQVLIEGSDL